MSWRGHAFYKKGLEIPAGEELRKKEWKPTRPGVPASEPRSRCPRPTHVPLTSHSRPTHVPYVHQVSRCPQMPSEALSLVLSAP